MQAKDAAGNTDASPASVTWTITKLTPVLTWANPADITYPTALSGTQLNATADVAGSFAYTPASGTILNAGNSQALKVDFTPTDTTNYSTASKTVTINVLKADPVVTAMGNTCTYNNSPCAGSGSAKGVLGEVLTPVNVAYKDALGNLLTSAPVNAGTYSVAARYAGDANYNQKQSAPATITITPASSTTTVTCLSVTYTGAPQTPCSASVTGAGGLSSSLPVSYANNVNAGMATASASFAGDTNHAGSSGSKTFTILKANASCTVTGYSVTYDGSAHTATGTCTGVLGEILSGLNLSGTTHTNAGTYSDSWTFTDSTGNYNNASSTVSDSISPALGDGDYTGLLDYATASATTTTALVSSSAFVHVTTGDITTATVTFSSIGSPNFSSCIAKVGRISGSIGGDQTGSAACTWSGSTGGSSTPGQSYSVGFTVGGNYSYVGDQVSVNVHLPSQTNFITGGGYLVLTQNTVGKYAGDQGSKANFGANVKYNKSGTNLQGNVNIIVRQGATEYQFKSNSLIQLNVNTTVSPFSATFTSKASGQSWPKANPSAVTPLGGNWTIQLKMTDMAEPGAGKDTIGITVWDGSGALVFSSNWDTSATPSPTTKEQVLGGGNLQVH